LNRWNKGNISKKYKNINNSSSKLAQVHFLHDTNSIYAIPRINRTLPIRTNALSAKRLKFKENNRKNAADPSSLREKEVFINMIDEENENERNIIECIVSGNFQTISAAAIRSSSVSSLTTDAESSKFSVNLPDAVGWEYNTLLPC